MTQLTQHIKFNYNYRDAGGNQKSGIIILQNTTGIKNLRSIESEIRKHLFDQEFFYPYKLGVPSLYFDQWDRELDHDWYYFDGLEFTDEPSTDTRSFDLFLADIKRFAKVPVI